jgi:hypothetical protein
MVDLALAPILMTGTMISKLSKADLHPILMNFEIMVPVTKIKKTVSKFNLLNFDTGHPVKSGGGKF